MTPSMNAALLSALVFPGAGQIYLKRIARGLAFIVPTAFAAPIYVMNLYEHVQALTDRIASGSLPLDPIAIQLAIAQQTDANILPTLAGWVLVICWIGSTIDAWLLGRPKTGD
jgi:hypothetical protein